MKKLLQEPLLHFLLIALALFWAYASINPENNTDYSIIISEARLQQLNNRFQATWRRAPSPEETQQLIRNYALDEIYYREARALGLDKDDAVVKKRLRQKMEFMLQDSTPQTPQPGELEAFFQQHQSNYRQPARYSFEQVFISIDRQKTELDKRLADQNKNISAGNKPLGDPSLLPDNINTASENEITKQFGQRFYDALSGLPQKIWQGPIESELGLHFIYLHNSMPSSIPALTDIQADVINDWRYQQTLSIRSDFEKQLLQRYNIVVAPKIIVAPKP